MQRCLLNVVCGLIGAAVCACTASPTAPSSSSPPPPASPFVNVVGNYRLTIEIDEKCTEIPQTLRVRAYDVAVEDKGWHFIPVRIVGEGFGYLGGELWPPSPDGRYRFEWNNFDVGGCDYPEPIGSTQFYVCGDGFGTLSESTISGVIHGGAFFEGSGPRVYCRLPGGASHRFELVRQAR